MSQGIFFLALVGSFGIALPARAQVVQLPTFHFFTVETSVSVPDRGGAFLGGVGRSSMGTQQFAPPWMPPSRAGGYNSSAHNLGVTATIHDLSGPARGTAPATSSADELFRDRLSSASRDQIPRDATVRQLAAERDARDARRFLELGDRARNAGKFDVAKVYYMMCARRAQGDLARTAAERLASLANVAQVSHSK